MSNQNTSKRGFKRDLNPGTKKMTALAKLRRNQEPKPIRKPHETALCKRLSRGAEEAQLGITKFVRDQKLLRKKMARDAATIKLQEIAKRKPPKANLSKRHQNYGQHPHTAYDNYNGNNA